MKRGLIGIFILLMMIEIIGCSAQHTAYATDGEKAAVMAASKRFYAALNAMFTGNIKPMKEVWSHADDVTYMGPGGGLQVGWDDVLATWETQAAMKLGGEVKPSDMQIVVGRDIAVTSNYEKGNNTNIHGKVEEVFIRVTNTYRKENGQWKMIAHHTDLLPHLEKGVQNE